MQVSKPVMIVVIVIAVLVVGFIGFKSLGGKQGGSEERIMAPQMMQGQQGGAAQPVPAQPSR